MRLGFNLPNVGPVAGDENIATVARRAEALGYHTLWTTERVLVPVDPMTGWRGSKELPIPEQYKLQLDPLDSLAYAAGVTERVRLGTSALDLPYYNPVLLARRLTTIDILSRGRLTVGLAQGWCPEEFEAVGASMKERGSRADEALAVMHTIWKDDPIEFHGKYYSIPKSTIQPKPVQKPHPPIIMAAFAQSSLRRVANLADGWLPVSLPVPVMKQRWGEIQGMAREAGRDPSELQLVVKANFTIAADPLGEGRTIFVGSEDEIRRDIAAVREMGADEIEFDPSTGAQGNTLKSWLEAMERMRELAA
jgi:probable F420-dependent oxidoreductase